MPKYNSNLFDQYVDKVYSLCRKYTRDSNYAKDLMQECFLHLYENMHKFDESRGTKDGWVFKVSTNVILKQLKNLKNSKTDDISIIENLSSDIEIEVEKIDAKILFATLDQLPAGYKEVLSMYILENKSHKEIANHLNISESTSRSQLTRAKLYFKDKIQKISYEKY